MFYLKVSFHVFNYRDKQNRNEHPPSRNVFSQKNKCTKWTRALYLGFSYTEQFVHVWGILSTELITILLLLSHY